VPQGGLRISPICMPWNESTRIFHDFTSIC
jgi:hypothetical protein